MCDAHGPRPGRMVGNRKLRIRTQRAGRIYGCHFTVGLVLSQGQIHRLSQSHAAVCISKLNSCGAS